MDWKIKVWIFLIISAFLIGYPFFAIKYLETETAFRITTKYFLGPCLLILILYGPRFYFKKAKPLDKFQTNSKFKEKSRDVMSILMMIGCSCFLFCGIFFSLLITTNSFGHSQKVVINEVVKKYNSEIMKNGRLRHYVDINNPLTNQIIHLEVYRVYKKGEVFRKEMNYGFWNILYSKE